MNTNKRKKVYTFLTSQGVKMSGAKAARRLRELEEGWRHCPHFFESRAEGCPSCSCGCAWQANPDYCPKIGAEWRELKDIEEKIKKLEEIDNPTPTIWR